VLTVATFTNLTGRKYVDGLPVYTEDELKIGKGGGKFIPLAFQMMACGS